MALNTLHEIHERKKSKNVGVMLVLVALICVVFGLTVVKVQQLGAVQAFDHVLRPELLPGESLE